MGGPRAFSRRLRDLMFPGSIDWDGWNNRPLTAPVACAFVVRCLKRNFGPYWCANIRGYRSRRPLNGRTLLRRSCPL